MCGKCKLLNYQTRSRTASFTPPTRLILDLRSKLLYLKTIPNALSRFSPLLLFNLSRWKQPTLSLNYSWWIAKLESVKSMFSTLSQPKVKAYEVGYSGYPSPTFCESKLYFYSKIINIVKYFSSRSSIHSIQHWNCYYKKYT